MTIWIYIPYCLKMHSLTPFNPTPLERQDPLTREYQREATLLKSLTPPQKLSGHGSSGSEWSEVEVNAVRAVPSLDQDPSRIIFEQYFPIDDDQGIYLRNIPFLNILLTSSLVSRVRKACQVYLCGEHR